MRFVGGLRLLAAAMCLGTIAATATAQEDAWATAMGAGLASYNQGHYEDAEKEFEAALLASENFEAKDPRRSRALNLLAIVAYQRDDLAGAEAAARCAWRSPRRTWARASRGGRGRLDRRVDRAGEGPPR